MPSKKPQFVIRGDKEIFDKICYIASEHERSGTQEIMYLIKERIKDYESIHGTLIIENDGTIHPDITMMGKSSTLKSG